METWEMRQRRIQAQARKEKIKVAVAELLGFSCGFLCGKLTLLVLGIR